MQEEIKVLPTNHLSLIEAYKRLMDYYYPKNTVRELNPFNGYFGGSNANATYPFIGQSDDGEEESITSPFADLPRQDYMIKPQRRSR